jgi:hypothetical protein
MKNELTQYDYLKMIRKPTLGRGPVFRDKTKYNRKQKHKGGW